MKIIQRVPFDAGSASVAASNDALLTEVIAVMKANPTWFLRVEAHADVSEGNGAASRVALSKRRGDAIVARLTALGYDPKRVRVSAVGDTRPILDSSTPGGRAENRGASFTVEKEDGSPVNP